MENESELHSVVVRSLGQTPSGAEMADAAFLSRFHFHRTFRQSLGETPVKLIRRLNLEKAAFSLRATDKDVLRIALESGYRSHEGFTRAFRRAFHLSPRAYRHAARRIRELPGASGLHVDTRGHTAITTKGKRKMDLIDRMLTSDFTAKRRLLECGQLLTDRQLDAPLAFRHTLMPFVEPARTLRESLARIVESHWVDGMFQALGYSPVDAAYRTLSGDSPQQFLARLTSFHTSFRAFVEYVRQENLWDTEWVDEDCDQPETFAVGAVLEATLTWDIAYRTMLERQFEAMGFDLGI